ncbi:hypothetical protein A1O3_07869 [Capronia epimyces CBS 606.96]|uniref:Ca2+-modulated nonselective cation channel polycystin n=1 Tax=Capronia epimyces CBS 606.96 TaxID=1182542 RepID=W9XQI5_9EURO|nr:uncharacterized protein A1O3_07869 [Capronia epimyces CBS 606.96]EXJ79590.1 hypothetical protein A1O3_07869 [Capronia epimyces CBS 606.96]
MRLTSGADRHGRHRPFATWMRRLANLKPLHVDSSDAAASPRRSNLHMTIKSKKGNIAKNNPYPLSSRPEAHSHGHLSSSAPLSSQRSRHSSISQSKNSVSVSHDSQAGNKSRAPTLATQAETTRSDAAPSGVGTSATATKTDGGRDSTFSSPAPSVRSMATTLTTVQSIAPGQNNPTAPMLTNASTASNSTPSYGGPPATAVPAHLAPHAHPTTYQSATANNILTDDASILTLASSSKRRRRNSVDTNASMKALAPASMFGGSRESLPLSVLSGTVIHPTADNASFREGGGTVHTRSNFSAERASLISASGVTAPVLASERNSYIGSKYGDGASVRSGLLGAGHGRNDSMSGSIGGQREKEKEREREKDRESGMVTAPTSPLVDGPGAGTQYTSALGDFAKASDTEGAGHVNG